MLTRRRTVLGGLLTIVFSYVNSSRCLAEHGGDHYHGCFITAPQARQLLGSSEVRSFNLGTEPIRQSGNRAFDRALAHTLAKLANTFGVLPGFAYYADGSEHNAFATPAQLLEKTDGTVMFGLGMLQRLMSGNDHPELSVAAVCAHEFGHIYQYKHGLMDVVNAGAATVKRSELQADYLAGFFAGLRKRERPEFPAAVFAQTQHNFGDNMIDHPSHHGTPNERADAIVAGFHFAMNGNSLDQAADESTRYVMRLKG
ncbi:hypothetical protein ACVWY1_001137 [Pseudomonas sp. TE6288]